MLTKLDLVNESEAGVVRNKLSKVAPTVAYRKGDDSFLSKLKKAFEEGEGKKGKLTKYDKDKDETKLVGVFGYPFVGKETLLEELSATVSKDKKPDMVDDDEDDEEEQGEAEMEEDDDDQEIIIGHGFSLVKMPGITSKKEQSSDSLILQGAFKADDPKIDAKALLKNLMNEEVCKKKELCRAYRIPAKFNNVDSWLALVEPKLPKED